MKNLSVVLVFVGLLGINAMKADLAKKIARARLEKEGLPDPVCRTGIISLPVESLGKKQACCPNYCKQCNDYKTCESVREQDSKNACCASKVLKMECGKGAPANVCLKKCSEALPPCIMEDGQVWKLKPPKTNAADDCNKAPSQWRLHGKAAIKAGEEAAFKYEAKKALKELLEVLETHKKLVVETAKTVKEVKADIAADEAKFKEVESVEELLDKELKQAVKIHDFLAQADLHKLKAELKNATAEAKAAEKGVSDAVTDMETAKKDLEGYLEVLTGHAKKAKETDPAFLLDKQQDIDVVHETAEKMRGLQVTINTDTPIFEKALEEAKANAAKAKEIAEEMKTTTTTTTTVHSCSCQHCGGDEPFPSADVCGPPSSVCGPSSPGNNGCWSETDNSNTAMACVCSTGKVVQPCQCYHCGGSETFNSADVCGAASDVCGPTSPDNGGCWNNVDGATCQCSDFQTTG